MINKKTVTAILLAAGSGTRFGANKNKVYVEILREANCYIQFASI